MRLNFPPTSVGERLLKLADRVTVETVHAVCKVRIEATLTESDTGMSAGEFDELVSELTRIALKTRRRAEQEQLELLEGDDDGEECYG